MKTNFLEGSNFSRYNSMSFLFRSAALPAFIVSIPMEGNCVGRFSLGLLTDVHRLFQECKQKVFSPFFFKSKRVSETKTMHDDVKLYGLSSDILDVSIEASIKMRRKKSLSFLKKVYFA